VVGSQSGEIKGSDDSLKEALDALLEEMDKAIRISSMARKNGLTYGAAKALDAERVKEKEDRERIMIAQETRKERSDW